ncbi:MAG: hypothetical protein P1P88_08680 [Bacteroidales bacterium]|nr:hypothetical protein [Bacteroidales bacterium]
MKKLPYILYVVFLILGCNSESNKTLDKETNFFYVRYDLEHDFGYGLGLYLDTVNIKYNVEIEDSIYAIDYLYTIDSITDTITYKLKESDNFKPEYLLNGKKKEFDDFVYVAKENYLLQNQSFDIYKYASNPMTIDGCMTHFWTPKIGVILIRSTTWRNFRKLQTDNDSINSYVNILTELIYQNNEFFKGCTEELELISKSDAKEFYSRKYKDIIDVIND